jgi:hypothetical protein
MGNSPGPKIKKMGVQWAQKLKNGQKPGPKSKFGAILFFPSNSSVA